MFDLSRVFALFERFVSAFERAVDVLENPANPEPDPDETVVDWRGVRDVLGLTASSAAVINRKVRDGVIPPPDALPGPRGKQRWYRETLVRFARDQQRAVQAALPGNSSGALTRSAR